VAAELDGAGALRWRFVYAAGRHVPDAAIDGAGVVYRIVTDQVGSLRLVVRASDGVVVQRMRHDAWGRVEEDFVAAGVARVPFGFAGGVFDRGTGLVHFGAREYDPRVGRWTAKDPIRWAGGTTGLYLYVGGRPGDLVDPNGLNPFGIGAALAACFASGVCEAAAVGAAQAGVAAAAGAATALAASRLTAKYARRVADDAPPCPPSPDGGKPECETTVKDYCINDVCGRLVGLPVSRNLQGAMHGACVTQCMMLNGC
jgi:RHS repeat-associated protein